MAETETIDADAAEPNAGALQATMDEAGGTRSPLTFSINFCMGIADVVSGPWLLAQRSPQSHCKRRLLAWRHLHRKNRSRQQLTPKLCLAWRKSVASRSRSTLGYSCGLTTACYIDDGCDKIRREQVAPTVSMFMSETDALNDLAAEEDEEEGGTAASGSAQDQQAMKAAEQGVCPCSFRAVP